MKIGIIGLPNVGKSTLFKALTKNPVDISNYPFCTIEPNIGIVKVPDQRLLKLAEMSQSKKVVPAIVEFVDIAGLVKGASVGEGLGNKFLANIREVDAIIQVVRFFQNAKITHIYNKINPQEDIEIINAELILADLETVKKVRIRVEKDQKRSAKGASVQLEIIDKIQKKLEAGKLANETILDLKEENTHLITRELSLLTMKPFLYVYNTDNFSPLPNELEKNNHIKLDIKIEEELIEMTPEEKIELELKSNLDQLILKAYKILDLITFFTTGKDESRAWTIKKNSPAPVAGSAIHTDFEEKFIRAEIIQWQELLNIGSWSKARELGKLRLEGKNYIVQDGEVIEFKI
ncbi:MAG: redox-regulated ATPase YchF [Candidatus Moranbacteria bacterium CG_4_8_14_3_um_filter_34_16]|nr:MAG: redox-regulated ATPase YchF [Candidatus Moranbacteria bacterium CG08_land_8_20_14_0_20_34_16]PIW94832.1 MAG: redox-regulated ATPase YchF [Candidatus Moranbacteria bacterium CG_4_8_14_3_um_filter_34_16]